MDKDKKIKELEEAKIIIKDRIDENKSWIEYGLLIDEHLGITEETNKRFKENKKEENKELIQAIKKLNEI